MNAPSWRNSHRKYKSVTTLVLLRGVVDQPAPEGELERHNGEGEH